MPGPDPRTRRTRDPKMGPLGKGKKKTTPLQIVIIGEDGKEKMGTFDADGKIQFRKGGRVCKLAKRGKGRAYGKNS